MSDHLLKAMLEPCNMVMLTSRWPNGRWSIQNISYGTTELYPQMEYADRNAERIRRTTRSMVREGGAEASEAKILRASFQEIEFICGGTP